MTISVSPPNSLSYQIPEDISFTSDPKQFTQQLTTLYSVASRAINAKDIGIYPNQEVLCGQKIFGFTSTGDVDPRKFREIYRKSIPIGAVAAGALSTTAPERVTFK